MLSEKILLLRKRAGLSQEELAEKLKVSRQAVSRWEVGSALPDAMNILQLSKLFGVTADYLLNDDYESDLDVPAVKNADTAAVNKVRKTAGLCIASAGVIGNFIIYILSRTIEVMVPAVTYDEAGKKWYTWSSEIKDYSYKYFIQEYNLELLTFVFFLLIIVGIAAILIDKERAGRILQKIRAKIPFRKSCSQTTGQDI